MNQTNNENTSPLRGEAASTGVIARLRQLVPVTSMDFRATLRLAERQAGELLRLSAHDDATPVSTSVVTDLSRIRVAYEPIGDSGMSHYVDGVWLIVINTADHRLRQRFTLLHELKHIIDHKHARRLYPGKPWLTGEERAADAKRERERAADYFAGCVLMPKSRMLRLWANGLRKPAEFAVHFDVSAAAAKVRLEQVGLTRPGWMCTRGLRTPDPTMPMPAFDRAVEETVATMRSLGLREPGAPRTGGRPSMRNRTRTRTLHHPSTARRFA